MNPITLTITISDAGCNVEGPLSDKFTCYAMLELAKDAIRNAADKPTQGNGSPLILPANGLRLT